MDAKAAMKQAVLFYGLDDAQLEQLVGISHARTYTRNQVVFSEGDSGDGMYIIGSGQVAVAQVDDDGNTTPSLYLGEGQIVGEMSLVDGAARSASIVAVDEGTEIYYIATEDFTALCQKNTDIGYIMMRNIAQDLSFKLRHRHSSPNLTKH